jgi:D-glycero-D-manno-heptose 1,7-bisphosphate phosphatase
MIADFDWKGGPSRTLFLDRDGVLNERLPGAYVKHPDDFKWARGLPEQLSVLPRLFETIVVVTNQQGIGKGLMSEQELDKIHEKMLGDVQAAGGRIDKIYHCGDLENSGSFLRKPSVGMALAAKKDFPHIHFKRAIMIGDTLSDMLFGKRLKMKTILIDANPDTARLNPRLVDLRFASLSECITFISEQAR